MADQKFQPQSTSQTDTDLFVKGMTKDPNASLTGQQNWTHARNAINNSKDGDVGSIGNEPANLSCVTIPYTIIGTIYLYGDKWVIFSTDDISSEIGMFDDSTCTYETIVNDPCLSFNRLHLVTGASKENFDCSWQIYWDDGNNPSRTLNLDRIPWVLRESSPPGADCVTYEIDPPQRLNCEWIRLAPLVDVPCVVVNKNKDGGQLRNGAYQAFIAYVVNEQKVGDFIGISNIQTLFDHEDTSGSIDINVTNLDKEFKFYMLVIVSNNGGQMQAKQVGLYSTEQTRIGLDYIDQKLPSVPLATIPLRNPAYEKSDKMYIVNDYLIRQGPYENFDFNYQPLANQIDTHWLSVQYPADYYANGGNKPTFMRDEQYAFFIRFVYNTGERSQSYHIPGRAPDSTTEAGTYGVPSERTGLVLGTNVLSAGEPFWRVYNTATVNTGLPGAAINDTTDDGGLIVSKGKMGYWESSEMYPATDPVRWAELCGEHIRHHKFPDELTDPNGLTQRNSNDSQSIYVLGVEFDNIAWPTFNDGVTPIPNLVGYEILVGAREGNKSIIAKGLLRNMRQYNVDADGEGSPNINGLIPNFPFNQVVGNTAEDCDPYHFQSCTVTNDSGSFYGNIFSRRDFYTFHSPETSFNHVYLNPFELRSYGVNSGTSVGRFYKSEKHPGVKLLRNFSAIVAAIIGAGYAIQQMRGERIIKQKEAKVTSTGKDPGPVTDGQNNRRDNIQNNPSNITQTPYTTSYNGGTYSTPNFLGIFGEGTVYSGLSYTVTPTPLVQAQYTDNYQGTQDTVNSWNHGFAGAIDHTQEKGQTDSPNNEYYTTTADQATAGQTADDSVGGTQAGTVQGQSAEGTTVTYPTVTTGVPGSTAAEVGGVIPLDREGQMTFSPLNPVASPGGQEERYMDDSRMGQEQVARSTPGSVGPEKSVEHRGSRHKSLPSLIELAQGIMSFLTLMSDGGQVIIDLIYNMSSYQQHAIKYNGHGLYRETHQPSGSKYNVTNVFRDRVDKARYVADSFQNIDANWKVNNLFRPKTVVIKTEDAGLTRPDQWGGAPTDTSRFTLSGAVPNFDGSTDMASCVATISAHYGALKVNFDNQYGQLDGIRQVPIRGCIDYFDPNYDSNTNIINPNTTQRYTTQPLFGGDCYIARYTEKVIKPFFWDFLYEQPDGFPYNYKLRQNSPCPRFWFNSEKYDMSNFVAPLINLTFDFGGSPFGSGGPLPSTFYNLDRSSFDIQDNDAGGGQGGGLGLGGLFVHKRGYIYTHCNGVNDIFVESELNMAHRDWEDRDGERHYDWLENTDVKGLFDAKIIKEGNFYKYDPSLSKSKLFSQLISFGTIQPRDYNPIISEFCYVHYPKRLIYSMQAQKEAKMDFWRIFLPNNYKDFKNQVNVIKPISKNGAIIFFPHLSPQMFQGVDQLTTDLNTKITIGDGGLFTSIPQTNVTNADLPHEYGSCESARSVINTPSGLFYISQAQGKVFQYGGGGITNIANNGMKQWFNKYLPSRLLASFPDIEKLDEVIDNPVTGVGCQSVYDPNYDIVYFCKRDYEPIHRECMRYEEGVGFIYDEALCSGEDTTELGNQYECEDGYDLVFSTDPEVLQAVGDWISNGAWVCECNEITYVENEFQPGEDTYQGGYVTPDPEPCPLDIMISVDASDSLVGNSNQEEMEEILLALLGHKKEGGIYVPDLDNPAFLPGIQDGTIRVGFFAWGADEINPGYEAGANGRIWTTDDITSNEESGSGAPVRLNLTDDINNSLLPWIAAYKLFINSTTSNNTNHAVALWEGLDMLYNPGWDVTDNDDSSQNIIAPSYEFARKDVNKVLIFITDGASNSGQSPSSGFPLADGSTTLDNYNPYVPFQRSLRPRLSYPGTTKDEQRAIYNGASGGSGQCKDSGAWGGCGSDSGIMGWQINGFVQSDDWDMDAKAYWMPLKGLDAGYVSRARCTNDLDLYYPVDPDVSIVIPTNDADLIDDLLNNTASAEIIDSASWYDDDGNTQTGKLYTTPVMGDSWAPYSQCEAGPYGILDHTDPTCPGCFNTGSDLANWWNNFVIGDINGQNAAATDGRLVIYKEDDLVNHWGSLTVFPIFLKNQTPGAAVTNAEIDYIKEYASHPKNINHATGYFDSDSIRTIVDTITSQLCPPPEPVWDPYSIFIPGVDQVIDGICPPNTTWIEDVAPIGVTGYGGINCICDDVQLATNIGEGFHVELDDTEYFRDLSWTVSYDPKIQGWISFHDWHPELTMPSLKHFLTTKTRLSDTPTCPEGYFFEETGENEGQCCQDEQVTQDSVNTLEYGEFDYTPGIPGGWTGDTDAQEITVNNGNFEVGPDDTVGGGYLPAPWVKCTTPDENPSNPCGMNNYMKRCADVSPCNCTQYYFDASEVAGSQTPDTLPFTNCLNSEWGEWDNFPAYSGNNYIGMVYRYLSGGAWCDPNEGESMNIYEPPAIWQEGISQEMSTPMVGGATYNTTLAIAVPDNNINELGDSYTSQGIQIWGGFGNCACEDNVSTHQSEMLWESGLIQNVNAQYEREWVVHNVVMNPTNNFTHLHIRIYTEENQTNSVGSANHKEYIVIDDFAPNGINPDMGEYIDPVAAICECEDGFEMVDGQGNPTDVCREENQCVRVNCECREYLGVEASSQTGECDTLEEYMGLETNSFPITCFYDLQNCVEANWEVGGIWKHNVRCDLFANYYTYQYPWEIELVSSMGQTVEMLRSVEYQLEVFDYITTYAKDDLGNDILDQPLNLNCEDRYQELTYNFNEAIIYNQEQISGLLKLSMQPTDPPLITSYPIIGGADIEILYDKVEQQFRFNQFWDITNDRNVAETQFITQMNGYIRDLNQANMDYSKPELQRKKFRNYYNKVLLRRMPIEAGYDQHGIMRYEPENKKMLLKLVNTKLNHSFR